MLLNSPSVYVKDTRTAKGRGVFALRAFTAGEVIEVCPVVVFQVSSAPLPQEVKKLLFDWGVLAGVAGTEALALGYGSMYNHNNPANMRYEADGLDLLLRFIAVRDINIDEELTVNYNAVGGGAEWHNDNWFERMKVKPITG